MESEKLARLLYHSTPSDLVNEVTVMNLFQRSEVNNKRDNVTGLLLYSGKMFVQVLEGDPLVITNTFSRIVRDSRHTKVTLSHFVNVGERLFADWGMGRVGATDAERVVIKRYFPNGMTDSSLIASDCLEKFLKIAEEAKKVL